MMMSLIVPLARRMVQCPSFDIQNIIGGEDMIYSSRGLTCKELLIYLLLCKENHEKILYIIIGRLPFHYFWHMFTVLVSYCNVDALAG